MRIHKIVHIHYIYLHIKPLVNRIELSKLILYELKHEMCLVNNSTNFRDKTL